MSPSEVGEPVYVAARLFSPACAHLVELGRDPAPALRAVGLPANILDTPDQRVLDWRMSAFIDHCETLTGDPFFGLHAGEKFRSGDYGLLEALIRQSDDTLDIPALVNQFSPLLGGTGRPILRTAGEDLVIYTVGFSDPHPASTPGSVYYAMASAFMMAHHFSDGDDLVAWVSFRHAAPADVGELERFFGADVRFDADEDAVAFEVAATTDRARVADIELRDMLQSRAEARLYALSQTASTEAAVRAILTQAIADEFAEGAVASRLAVSERTLRRRLQDEGSSFSDVRDAVRHVRAQRMLSETDEPIADIGYQLGFGETGGLRRAFKRWTGESPGAYRKRTRPRPS